MESIQVMSGVKLMVNKSIYIPPMVTLSFNDYNNEIQSNPLAREKVKEAEHS